MGKDVIVGGIWGAAFSALVVAGVVMLAPEQAPTAANETEAPAEVAETPVETTPERAASAPEPRPEIEPEVMAEAPEPEPEVEFAEAPVVEPETPEAETTAEVVTPEPEPVETVENEAPAAPEVETPDPVVTEVEPEVAPEPEAAPVVVAETPVAPAPAPESSSTAPAAIQEPEEVTTADLAAPEPEEPVAPRRPISLAEAMAGAKPPSASTAPAPKAPVVAAEPKPAEPPVTAPVVVAEPAEPVTPDTAPSVTAEAETPALKPAPEATAEAQPEPTPAPVVEAEPEEAPEPVVVAAAEPEAPASRPRILQLGDANSNSRPRVGTAPQTGFGNSANVRVNRLPGIGQTPEDTADQATAEVETSDLPPVKRFAIPFENTDGLPVLAVVLIDAEGVDPAALASLPFPVTVAIDPTADGAGGRAQSFRDAGMEIAILATGIPRGAKPADLEVTFQSYKRALPNAVAVIDTPEANFQNDRQLAKHMVALVQAEGLGLITYDKGLNPADQLAQAEGLAHVEAFRVIDEGDVSAQGIRRTLDRAAFEAGRQGQVLIVGHTYVDTLEALKEWAENDGERTMMAPASAAALSSVGG